MILALLGAALAGQWEVASLYDASAHGLRDPTSPGWVWDPPTGMVTSCGPAKAPDGLGVMEAQSMASASSPTLAILLRRTSPDTEAPEHSHITLSLHLGEQKVSLAPFVEPRYLGMQLQVDPDRPVPAADRQLLRTQLEMELCMEHKTGRAWRGGSAEQLRQAFLLRSPGPEGAHRLHYRGQADPVSAYLGPPDACFWPEAGPAEARLIDPGVSTSLRLVPADVWGASLRTCPSSVTGAVDPPPSRLPIIASDGSSSEQEPRWSKLEVLLYAGAQGQTLLQAGLDGAELLRDQPLHVALEDGTEGIFDLAAHLPVRYPTWGDRDDPERYILLLVPNWQLVEAARDMGQLPDRGAALVDGVGWALARPEMIFVQVADREGELPNLASRLEAPSALRWGFVVGANASRSPILLPGDRQPQPGDQAEAQRAPRQSVFLGSFLVLLFGLLASLGRLRDLWVVTPVERVNYWPGVPEPAKEGGGAPEPLGAVGEDSE